MQIIPAFLTSFVAKAAAAIRLRPNPSPTATVKAVNAEAMFLEVTNAGESGDFVAKLELLQGVEKVHQTGIPVDFHGYAGFWERGHGPSSTLSRGQKDRLIIGRVQEAPPELPPAAMFKMAFYDQVDRSYAEYGTTGWIAGISGIAPPRLIFRVTISSSPQSRKGPYVNTFVVDHDDRLPLRDEKSTWITGVFVRHY